MCGVNVVCAAFVCYKFYFKIFTFFCVSVLKIDYFYVKIKE